jgi:serine/threonine protein kinase
VTIASLVLALWHHLRMKSGEDRSYGPGMREGDETRVGRREPVPSGPDLPSPFPGDLLTRFAEPVVIGSGGVSRVFRARRRDTGRMVAVKVPLAMDEATGMSFLKEMRAWEGLHHGNIVRILGANILPVPYVEMEYLPRSLDDLEKPLDTRVAARIVAGIARGLAFAHGRGIIHRDLKPGNILVTDALEPKIGDWGLSRFTGGATATDISGFSPRYAAPEQLDPGRYGKPDRRTDIYGAGCIFYELVTGRPPFDGGSIAEITGRILTTDPVPPSVLNPATAPVEGIIVRCLEKEPGRRYQEAAALERDIREFLGG